MAKVAELEWGWPLILKPDVGQRGAGVKLVHSLAEAQKYLSDYAGAEGAAHADQAAVHGHGRSGAAFADVEIAVVAGETAQTGESSTAETSPAARLIFRDVMFFLPTNKVSTNVAL